MYNYNSSGKNREEISNDIKIAIQSFILDNPEVFYMASKYSEGNVSYIIGNIPYIKLEYLYEKDEIENKVIEVNNKLNEIIHNANKYSTDIDKEIYLHDYICTNVEYFSQDDKDTYHNIYSAIINNKAVCDGMAKSLEIMLQKVGIKTIMVIGELNNSPHAWLKVQLDDEWYNLDPTSDKYSTDIDAVAHTYFNRTDADVSEMLVPSTKYEVPKATATKYMYYNYKKYVVDKSYNFYSQLSYLSSFQSDKRYIEFQTNYTNDITEQTIKALYDLGIITSSGNNTQIMYYRELDTYIILKR